MTTSLAPIILFVYNRPSHTKRTIEALKKCRFATESELYIFCDGPKKNASVSTLESIDQVRRIVKNVDGFFSTQVIERDHNQGLANSVISGVSEILKRYPKAIVVEDDLIADEHFLSFLNHSLERYRDNKKVFSVTGYTYPLPISSDYKWDAFFEVRPHSWGWATWSDRWALVDWSVSDYENFKKNRSIRRSFNEVGGDDLTDMLDRQMEGEIDSWAIRWAYTHFKLDVLCLYPTRTHVLNIGHDGSGTHCGSMEPEEIRNQAFDLSVNPTVNFRFPTEVTVEKGIHKIFIRNHRWSIRTRLSIGFHRRKKKVTNYFR